MKKRVVEGVEIKLGSGNVFADLCLPDVNKLKVKSHLAVKLSYTTSHPTDDAQSPPEQRREDVAQMLASWHIEGFEPDDRFLALLDGYIAGELTLAEIRTRLVKEFATRAS